MIQFKKYEPDYTLKEYIQSYFSLETSAQKNAREPLHFFQNHSQGTFDLMFGMNGAIELVNHKEETSELSHIFTIGLQEGFFGVRFQPQTSIFGVVFYPESFSKLFNFPLNEIANGGRRLDDDLSISYIDIYDQLKECSSDIERVNLLNSFFLKQLSQIDFSFTKFDQLIKNNRLSANPMEISDMVNLSSLSERTVQRKMKQLLGVGPKSFSQVMRIKHVLTYIHDNPSKDWQDVLYLFGYYDQAHFIKDFKRYTGRTPKTFIKEDKGLSGHFLGDK